MLTRKEVRQTLILLGACKYPRRAQVPVKSYESLMCQILNHCLWIREVPNAPNFTRTLLSYTELSRISFGCSTQLIACDGKSSGFGKHLDNFTFRLS